MKFGTMTHIGPLQRIDRKNLEFLKIQDGVAAADIITCTKFFGDRSRGVYSVGGRKLPSPIDKASRR